ncbi:MAG: carboxypeptidase-like regulatory domain-containing protein [Bacteroidales bacterium]|nr:carboxypeptidase-like regulatory domain-containing protein [Bacteroidales bacterium]
MKKPLWINLFLILLLFLCCQNLHSQLIGSVYDAGSGEPLANVNIRVQDTRIGTTTNQLGEFSLFIKNYPVIISLSFVGYETKNIRLEMPPLQRIIINLDPKTEVLTGVTIVSERIDTLFSDREYSILDYELLDDGILLLIFRSRITRSELLYTDYDGNEKFKLTILPGKPAGLFKDCLNNIHLLTSSSVYQVFIDNENIRFYDPIDLDIFKSVMMDCMFTIKNRVYFKKSLFYDLVVQFYYVDRKDTTNHFLCEVFDENKIDFLYKNPENFMSSGAGNFGLADLRGLPVDTAILDKIRFDDVDLRFNRMAYYSEIYVPAFRLGDTVCIFNHPNAKIQFFNLSDSLVNEVPINYHTPKNLNTLSTLQNAFFKSTKWEKMILFDEPGKKAFAVYQNINGTKTLKEINLLTGETTIAMTVPFAHVQKMKVYNNYVYFIYKDWGETQKKKLFRQRVD